MSNVDTRNYREEFARHLALLNEHICQLTEAVTASLTIALEPAPELHEADRAQEAAPPIVPKKKEPAVPFGGWPEWGYEHMMSCRRTECPTCARLEATPQEPVAVET